jgi:hypothetical protein
MNWLDKIRQKDDGAKKAFAFWTSLVITLLIVLVWLFNLPYIFKHNEEGVQFASPVKAMWNRAENLFDFGPEVYRAE